MSYLYTENIPIYKLIVPSVRTYYPALKV